MAGLNARIGKAAATGLLAGAVGGFALLAGEVIAAKAPPVREADDGPGPAHLDGPDLRAHRCAWCCSATRPRSASGVEWLSDTVGGQLARLLAEGGADTASGTCCSPASAWPAPARPTSPPRSPGRCSATARTWPWC